MMDILDYKEKITKIYFVRHGETNANVRHLLFGHLDWDLTENGVRQARKAGLKIVSAYRRAGVSAKEQIQYIISSPLKRARHTAKIIAKCLVGAGLAPARGLAPAPKITIDKNLIEQSQGAWEGKDYWVVRKEDPKNYKRWIKDPFRQKPPDGESFLVVNKRVKKFYKKVLKKYLGKNIIVVSHSGPIRLFILNLLGADINKLFHLHIDCGSITEVHVSKKHALVVRVNN